MPGTTSEVELLKKIKELNKNPDIDGFIVQLPLPPQIDTQKVLMAVDPDKDVDGFHPTNFGKMALDMSTFTQQLLWYFGITGALSSRNPREAYCSNRSFSYSRTSNEYFNGTKRIPW